MGEKQLNVSSISVIDSTIRPVNPANVTTSRAMNPAITGNLVRVEGRVSDIREAGGTISQFTVTDSSGVGALVFVNAYITPDIDLNFIQNGATVNVTGLASHGETDGGLQLSRIRVRDRGEIVRAEGISLSRSGTLTFTSRAFNVVPPASDARSFTIRNTGRHSVGPLTIELTGSGADSFTLSNNPAAERVGKIEDITLAAGATSSTFNVIPRTLRPAGTYTATVTVRGAGVVSQSFDVVFTVTVGAGATVQGPIVNVTPDAARHNSITVERVNPTEPNVGGQIVEYAVATGTALPTTGWRTGGVQTGTSAYETVTFRNLQPSTNYRVWARTAANINCDAGATVWLAVSTVSVPTLIAIDKSGTVTLANTPFGATLPESEVTITNSSPTAGSIATGPVTVELSGFDRSAFELVLGDNPAIAGPLTVPSIAESGETAKFTVKPAAGLTVGTYTATVTVTAGAGGVARSFNVSFTVTRAATGPALTGPLALNTATHNRITVNPLTSPNQAVQYAISEGTGTTEPTAGWQGSTVFTGLKPDTDYVVFARVASDTNSGAGPAITLVTKTSAEIYSIMLNRASLQIFGPVQSRYDPILPIIVLVTNNGSEPTGGLTVALSGPDSASFTLSENALPSLTVDGVDSAQSFDVGPKDGLPGGIHNATVTVSGGNGISESFDVRFTVNRRDGVAVTAANNWGAFGLTPQAANAAVVVNGVSVVNPPVGVEPDGVEYAIRLGSNAVAPTHGWQSENTLTHDVDGVLLRPNTSYRVFARMAGTGDYLPGSAQSRTVTTARVTVGIEINRETMDFAARAFNAAVPAALNVRVVNNSATTQNISLTVAEHCLVDGCNDTACFKLPEAADITSGGNRNFAVQPVRGAVFGSHSAKIKVGNASIEEFFTVSFDVNRLGTGATILPLVLTGANAVTIERTANSVTLNGVRITPNLPGGQDKVEFAIRAGTAGATPGDGWWVEGVLNQEGTFDITFEEDVNGNRLHPDTNYRVFARTEANVNCNAGTARGIQIRTLQAQDAIRLNRVGTLTFGARAFGAAPPARQSVTVTNIGIGGRPVEDLSVEISECDFCGGTCFVQASRLGRTNLVGIRSNPAAQRRTGFHVRPVAGLIGGTHTATVTVSGDPGGEGGDLISDVSFNVSFRVNPARGATVDRIPRRDLVTDESISVLPVLVAGANRGEQTVEYAISTRTRAPGSNTAANPDNWRAEPLFEDLEPNTIYRVFARTAANSNNNAGAARMSAAIRTDRADYAISLPGLPRTNLHTFRAATFGYGVQAAATFTVRNEGLEDTGLLKIELIGANPDSFELSMTSISASVLGSSRFTVRPVTGLNGGQHNATVRVYSEDLEIGIDKEFNVRFTVNRPSGTAARGANVTGAPNVITHTHNSITVSTVLPAEPNSGRQDVQYTIRAGTGTSAPTAAMWNEYNHLGANPNPNITVDETTGTVTFNNLVPGTTYRIFARTAQNGNRNAGTIVQTDLVTTLAVPVTLG
jgi:hypothetical protein